MANPTRTPNGLNNVKPGWTLGDYGLPDHTRYHEWLDDFDRYVAADWVVTETGTGSQAVVNGDGGILRLTTGNVSGNNGWLQWAGGSGAVVRSFRFEAGLPLFFKARVRLTDATASQMIVGLHINNTDLTATTDAVTFEKPSAATAVNFIVRKNSTASTASAIANMADNTFIVLGFHYNGKDEIEHFVNDAKTGDLPLTNLPDDEDLAVSFGLQTAAAAAKSMDLDYLIASKER